MYLLETRGSCIHLFKRSFIVATHAAATACFIIIINTQEVLVNNYIIYVTPFKNLYPALLNVKTTKQTSTHAAVQWSADPHTAGTGSSSFHSFHLSDGWEAAVLLFTLRYFCSSLFNFKYHQQNLYFWTTKTCSFCTNMTQFRCILSTTFWWTPRFRDTAVAKINLRLVILHSFCILCVCLLLLCLCFVRSKGVIVEFQAVATEIFSGLVSLNFINFCESFIGLQKFESELSPAFLWLKTDSNMLIS